MVAVGQRVSVGRGVRDGQRVGVAVAGLATGWMVLVGGWAVMVVGVGVMDGVSSTADVGVADGVSSAGGVGVAESPEEEAPRQGGTESAVPSGFCVCPCASYIFTA